MSTQVVFFAWQQQDDEKFRDVFWNTTSVRVQQIPLECENGYMMVGYPVIRDEVESIVSAVGGSLEVGYGQYPANIVPLVDFNVEIGG